VAWKNIYELSLITYVPTTSEITVPAGNGSRAVEIRASISTIHVNVISNMAIVPMAQDAPVRCLSS
jgi:hypothetical protein